MKTFGHKLFDMIGSKIWSRLWRFEIFEIYGFKRKEKKQFVN